MLQKERSENYRVVLYNDLSIFIKQNKICAIGRQTDAIFYIS
jgi:hypothetical protein